MRTQDTDPRRSSLVAGTGDTTEPGPPPEGSGTLPDGETDAQRAASLLADLAKAPLPTEGVRETEGHTAAAIALPAHRPPRAMKNGGVEPAVLVNVTEPLPRSGPMRVDVPVPPSVWPETKGLAGRRSAVQHSTVPSARVHRRQTAAIVIVIAVAALAAAALAALVPREPSPTPSGGGPAVQATSAAPPSAPSAPPATAPATAPAPAPPPATATATVAAAPPAQPSAPSPARAPATGSATASTPHPAGSAPRAPRSPSGGFEEPDRNF